MNKLITFCVKFRAVLVYFLNPSFDTKQKRRRKREEEEGKFQWLPEVITSIDLSISRAGFLPV